MLDLSIIIVSYNTKEYLIKCLESIKDTVSNKVRYEIIVVDNASTDGTSVAISDLNSHQFNPPRTKISNLKFIQNKDNMGFAKANNIGVKVAKGRYILFLNPDTLVKENVIEGLMSFMDEHKDAGAATCKLLLENGEIDYAIHRGFPTPWSAFSYFSGLGKVFKSSKLFSGYTMGWLDLTTTHEVDAVAGAFLFVRREAGESIGWWDEDYFFNGEDLDFCFELKEKGWKIYYVHNFSMLHYSGVAGGTKKHSQHITTASKESKKRIQKARFNAMKIFYKKHYIKKYPFIINWLVMKGIDIKERLA